MQCPACSRENAVANRFCEGCGAPFVVACRKCGHRNSPAASFCGACGEFLGPVQRPRHAVALDEVSAWGELKQATILFADVVSSTEIVANLTAEQAMERLRPAIDAMCDAVNRFGGTIVRTLGDGIMALFGAPQAQEGHALLACEAAIWMQEKFALFDNQMQVRVGLHSGEIVADPPMVEPFKERGAHGVAVHIANRVAALADPAGICLTEDCYRLVRPYCDVTSIGRRTLRGVSESLEIYTLVGLKPAVASAAFRGVNLTPFRGRQHEIDLLRRTLQETEDGGARVVGIAGAPGTGKSRLTYEFTEWCRGRLIPVFEARAHPYGHATPLQPVMQFLRSLFLFSPGDDATIARDRIARRLLRVNPTFAADLGLVYEFLGVSDDSGSVPQLLSKTRHQRLLDVVRDLVRHGGTELSVTVIEDLHWLDEMSHGFVNMLVDAVSGTRTMLILTYRSSYAAAWMQRSHFQQVSLADLSPSDSEALLDGLLGKRAGLQDVRDRVAERSAGNPFFAEELVRSLVQSGVLQGQPGDYDVGKNGTTGALPATVQAVIGARIDHLSETERAILQIAAIIGKDIPVDVVAEVAGVPMNDVATILDRLCAAELIQFHSGPEGSLYAFRHPLTQEVAYGTQLKARRGELHARVAKAMERVHGDRLDEFAGLLAYHCELAGQSLAAARYGARAAQWIGITSSALAIKQWHKVRRLLQDESARSGDRSPPHHGEQPDLLARVARGNDDGTSAAIHCRGTGLGAGGR